MHSESFLWLLRRCRRTSCGPTKGPRARRAWDSPTVWTKSSARRCPAWHVLRTSVADSLGGGASVRRSTPVLQRRDAQAAAHMQYTYSTHTVRKYNTNAVHKQYTIHIPAVLYHLLLSRKERIFVISLLDAAGPCQTAGIRFVYYLCTAFVYCLCSICVLYVHYTC